jgi:hypothetical protein
MVVASRDDGQRNIIFARREAELIVGRIVEDVESLRELVWEGTR